MHVMTKHYDPQLVYKLAAPEPRGAIVLNPYFHQWTETISGNLETGHSAGIMYDLGESKELLSACTAHARAHERKDTTGKCIVLTHPFYLHLTHMAELKNETVRQEADEYVDALLHFLCLNRDIFQTPVILFEMAHHYAAASSLLVERGLVDTVIFTVCHSGKPLNQDDVQQIKHGTLYFGGGYNGRCLRSSIVAVETIRSSTNNLWAIKELVLTSPYDNWNTLRTSCVSGIAPERTISLEDVLTQL